MNPNNPSFSIVTQVVSKNSLIMALDVADSNSGHSTVFDICTLIFARKFGFCYLGHSKEFHGCTMDDPENSVIVTYGMPENSSHFSTICNYFKFVSLHLQHFCSYPSFEAH